jgi:hypothetical protein
MRFEWGSEAFQEWRTPIVAEAAADGINRDAFQDTRWMLVERLATDDVQAIPVYGNDRT